MAITKERKVEIMTDLVSKLKKAKSIWFATTSMITVEEFAKLRKNLREVSASYTLAKKTIIKKAVKEALNIDIEIADMDWQIWVVCSNEDAIAGLGKLNVFMKEVNWPKWDLWKLVWSISIFDWQLKTKVETKVLASLPSKDILLGRLVGSMKSPISALARFFDAAKKDLESKWVSSIWELKNSIPKKDEAKAPETLKVKETQNISDNIQEDEKISPDNLSTNSSDTLSTTKEIKLEVPISEEWDKIEAIITPIEDTEKIPTKNTEITAEIEETKAE